MGMPEIDTELCERTINDILLKTEKVPNRAYGGWESRFSAFGQEWGCLWLR